MKVCDEVGLIEVSAVGGQASVVPAFIMDTGEGVAEPQNSGQQLWR
jgi:hypothetical protein